MKLIVPITKFTIQSIFRNHAFPLYSVLLLLGSIILPMVIKSDGTASGQLKISLTYTYGFIGFFLTFTTLWLSSSALVNEIESYQIHLILTKPVPSYVYWLGKWLGIVFIQSVLLILVSSVSYLLIHFKLKSSNYPPMAIQRVEHEILVGRKIVTPKTVNIDKIAKKELSQRIHNRMLPGNVDTNTVLDGLRREIAHRILEIPPGTEKQWEFHGLPPKNRSKLFHLRYRLYVNSTADRNQKETQGMWWILNSENKTFYPLSKNTVAGVFHELPISSKTIDKNGTLVLKYENKDPEAKSVIFEPSTPPTLLFKVTSFFQNFLRMVLLLLFQMVFAAILGCTAGAIFSAPMAVFISSSYIVLGMLVAILAFTFPDQNSSPGENIIYQIATLVRFMTMHITVPLNIHDGAHHLARGELIEGSRIVWIFTNLILLRGIPIGLLGWWLFNKREIGLTIKK